VGLVAVDEIYVTHFHADHYLGIPGLLKTYDLQGRERLLRVIGPPGLIELFKALRRIFGRLNYEVELVELDEGEAVRHDGYEVRSFPVEHSTRAYGYALVEDSRPGHFDPAAAERLGVAEGPDFGRLQRGEEVQGRDGIVRPDQVMGETRAGRKFVITGDTSPCEMTRLAAHEAQVLVHDGSFADEELARAIETGHSTARQAAELARAAGVSLLTLVHISSRYDVRDVLAEAREAFERAVAPRDFDLIEIPFPERGVPRLIEGGAKHPRRVNGPPAPEAQAEEAEVRSSSYEG
jgi:ribonuclease Z